MKGCISSRLPGQGGLRRQLAQLLGVLLSRIRSLAIQAEQLRAHVGRGPSHSYLRTCIDGLLIELRAAARELVVFAASLSTRVGAAGARPLCVNRIRVNKEQLLRILAKLPRALYAGCQASAARLPGIFRTAQATRDKAAAQVAYWLMRMLERLLVRLRPHIRNGAQSFSFPPTLGRMVAVGTGLTAGPPHRSERVGLPPSALTLSSGEEATRVFPMMHCVRLS
jgi:hypothetical protein